MFETIILTTAFLFITVCAYRDIKTNEIPDWINFAAISTAFGLQTLHSIFVWNYQPILSAVLGFVLFYAIGYVMFYTGQWGGGDSKLLMAIGAFLGFEFNMQTNTASFLIALILTGAAYGTIWSIALAIKNRKNFVNNTKKILTNKNFKLANKITLLTTILLLISAIITRDDKILFTTMAFTAIATPFFFYLFVLIKAVENCCIIRLAEPQELTEGDWIAKDIIVKGKKICGPKDLGISKTQIHILKKLKIKKILLKTGIPFTPSFWLAFILMWTYGNMLLKIIN